MDALLNDEQNSEGDSGPGHLQKRLRLGRCLSNLGSAAFLGRPLAWRWRALGRPITGRRCQKAVRRARPAASTRHTPPCPDAISFTVSSNTNRRSAVATSPASIDGRQGAGTLRPVTEIHITRHTDDIAVQLRSEALKTCFEPGSRFMNGELTLVFSVTHRGPRGYGRPGLVLSPARRPGRRG